MARTYRTLSLSLPPGVVEKLAAIGRHTGRTAARVAAEIVLRAIARIPDPKDETRRSSWCCQADVVPARGQLVLPESTFGERRWIPAVVLLCSTCGKQMHGREYERWISDA
jgi:hypothetical protein